MIDIHAPDGTRLALHDFGGTGTPLLLLPGLCGYAGEWSATAQWASHTHRVYGLDPRGHGASERRPRDVSREAHVGDVATVLHKIGQAVLVGQSLGGHTAMLTAAAHPQLVSRLVLIEAGPAGDDDQTSQRIEQWLASWPVPFADLDTATRFLGSPEWASGLVHGDDGWYPSFDRDVMVATIAAARPARWPEFEQIVCPILIVKGEKGFMEAGEFERMRRHPLATAVEIPAAGHDVHLDGEAALWAALADFLTRTHNAD